MDCDALLDAGILLQLLPTPSISNTGVLEGYRRE